jgi:hypothetical protein
VKGAIEKKKKRKANYLIDQLLSLRTFLAASSKPFFGYFC